MISGKEAAIAYLEGKEVLHVNHDFVDSDKWADCKGMGIDDFKNDKWAFKLKPRTITINGIEVPTPADDKDYHHQGIWILNSLEPKEYGYVLLDITDELPRYWWQTEEEIKQVVAALRSVFNDH